MKIQCVRAGAAMLCGHLHAYGIFSNQNLDHKTKFCMTTFISNIIHELTLIMLYTLSTVKTLL